MELILDFDKEMTWKKNRIICQIELFHLISSASICMSLAFVFMMGCSSSLARFSNNRPLTEKQRKFHWWKGGREWWGGFCRWDMDIAPHSWNERELQKENKRKGENILTKKRIYISNENWINKIMYGMNGMRVNDLLIKILHFSFAAARPPQCVWVSSASIHQQSFSFISPTMLMDKIRENGWQNVKNIYWMEKLWWKLIGGRIQRLSTQSHGRAASAEAAEGNGRSVSFSAWNVQRDIRCEFFSFAVIGGNKLEADWRNLKEDKYKLFNFNNYINK